MNYDHKDYGKFNNDWHSHDSFYKFSKIQPALEKFYSEFRGHTIRILDVGSGAGVFGALVGVFFHSKGVKVYYDSVEPNHELIENQKKINPFFSKHYSDWKDINKDYDICLCIDVIEHIEESSIFLDKLASSSQFGLFNIPIEVNLFDYFRNLYLGNYYDMQKETIGHLHFYSDASERKLFRSYSSLFREFAPYFDLIFTVHSVNHKKQLDSRLRALELSVSRIIFILLKGVSSRIIQGSVYSLIKFK
jgi:hypothetical protein